MFNQFLAENFAIGFRGYYYNQLSGDSGTGAILGPLKGSSVGVGPSLLWAPKAAKGKVSVILSWTHDLSATNRLKSDYVVITIAAPF